MLFEKKFKSPDVLTDIFNDIKIKNKQILCSVY